MARILLPVAQEGFDPSEAGIPFVHLKAQGHSFVIATLTGDIAVADPRMVFGTGLGVLAPVLKADPLGRRAYDTLASSTEFTHPIRYEAIDPSGFDALILPGGHDKPMRPYLESKVLQDVTRHFFDEQKPVAAICHGVIVAARTLGADGRSVLYGKKTTSLTRRQERLAFNLTRLWLGDYYLTYPETVEDEVTRALRSPDDYFTGPNAVLRDAPNKLARGFVVKDGHYLSARWPGDAHLFSDTLARMLT